MEKIKKIRFHIEMNEREATILEELRAHYSGSFGVKVSKAEAVKLAIKTTHREEGLG